MAVLIDTSKPLTVPQEVGGPRGALNSVDFKKLAVGLFVAVLGAALTYVTEAIGSVDLGEVWTPVVVVGWGLIVNTLRKLLDGSGHAKAVADLRKRDD